MKVTVSVQKGRSFSRFFFQLVSFLIFLWSSVTADFSYLSLSLIFYLLSSLFLFLYLSSYFFFLIFFLFFFRATTTRDFLWATGEDRGITSLNWATRVYGGFHWPLGIFFLFFIKAMGQGDGGAGSGVRGIMRFFH